MELEEFISRTLISISKGIKSANKEVIFGNGPSFKLQPVHKDGYIQFDVAVTASKAKGTKGGAGIKLWAMSLSGQKEGKVSDQSVSRIKFNIMPNTDIC